MPGTPSTAAENYNTTRQKNEATAPANHNIFMLCLLVGGTLMRGKLLTR